MIALIHSVAGARGEMDSRQGILFIFFSELRSQRPQAQKTGSELFEGLCVPTAGLTAVPMALDSGRHPHTETFGSLSDVNRRIVVGEDEVIPRRCSLFLWAKASLPFR